MTTSRDFRIELKDHGRMQLELLCHYPLTEEDYDRYNVDVWFYTPRPLGMTRHDYGVDRFFRDIKCLTRFSAPLMPLGQINDPECSLSPLTRIRKELTGAVMAREIPFKRVLYELRSLANIYESEILGSESILREAVKQGRFSSVKLAIKDTLKDLKTFLESWRNLYSQFLEPSVDVRLREAYAWADESISLTTERALYNLYTVFSSDKESAPLTKRILSIMEGEDQHRKAMGYRRLPTEATATEAESRIYRESVLKKWGQSALYLNHEDSGTSRRMNHILAGIAAAAAMSFAVAATLLAEKYFPGRSLPWAMAIVIAYIFKDRIKESLRGVLTHTLPSMITDQRVRLIDQATLTRVGNVSGRVRFLKARAVPPEISRMRNADGNPFRSILPEEDVVHYRRSILIRTRRLRQSHERLETFTDTIRYNLEHLIRNMDDPQKTIPSLSEGVARQIRGHRVYHVNVLVNLTRRGDPAQRLSRYRLVLSRRGLVRIETIDQFPI